MPAEAELANRRRHDRSAVLTQRDTRSADGERLGPERVAQHDPDPFPANARAHDLPERLVVEVQIGVEHQYRYERSGRSLDAWCLTPWRPLYWPLAAFDDGRGPRADPVLIVFPTLCEHGQVSGEDAHAKRGARDGPGHAPQKRPTSDLTHHLVAPAAHVYGAGKYAIISPRFVPSQISFPTCTAVVAAANPSM